MGEQSYRNRADSYRIHSSRHEGGYLEHLEQDHKANYSGGDSSNLNPKTEPDEKLQNINHQSENSSNSKREEEEEKKISPPKNFDVLPKKPSPDFYAPPHPFLNSRSSGGGGGNIKVEDGAASDLSQGIQ